VLTVLVHVYEEKQNDVPLPNPIDAIHYYMESRGLTRRDLGKYIGSRARVSEVLNRKHAITMDMIHKLHRGVGIPAEVLIQLYRTVEGAARDTFKSIALQRICTYDITKKRQKTRCDAIVCVHGRP
jgi:HTH-type transcriptional regulator / antitoxin HigA